MLVDQNIKTKNTLKKYRTIKEHLINLRLNVIIFLIYFAVIFFISFYFSDYIMDFLINPFKKLLEKNNYSSNLIATSLTENFFVAVKISLYFAILCVFPILNIHILMYLKEALNKQEKKIFIVISWLSLILFYGGAIICYYVFINIIFDFFMKFALTNLDVVLTPKINDYINSVMFFMILVGVIFLIPIIIFLLVYLNILNVENLKNNRKLIIFLSFVIAAIVTPPDPFSQIIIAMLMWFLYEISFILIKYFKI
jgi:sec-independent protein translocase protein TatC